MRLIHFIQVMVLMSLLSSCYYNKKLVYLQGSNLKQNQPVRVENKNSPYKLQVNDVISVRVKSPTDAQVASIFNITSETIGTSSNPGNLYMEGYSISQDGEITLPILGDIKVVGQSIEEAQQLIQTQANKYLNQATVLVKLVSFKVTVLGEVKNPGYHYVFNNQITVLEALGLAGDLTNFGNRKNIKLIRPVPTGSEVTLLDITDRDLLESPYFYLMPNDVLYVEPLRARSSRSNLEVWAVIFSAATTAILVLSYLETN